MVFKIKLAGRIIEIHSLYQEIYRLCRAYIIEEMQSIPEGTRSAFEGRQFSSAENSMEKISRDEEKTAPDIVIEIREADILREREKAAKSGEVSNPSDSYLETLAIYRKIAQEMLRFDTFLMHGAVVAVSGRMQDPAENAEISSADIKVTEDRAKVLSAEKAGTADTTALAGKKEGSADRVTISAENVLLSGEKKSPVANIEAGAVDQAYMITAPSGTGKTTRLRFWLQQIPGSYVVNGDKPLISLRDEQVYACGTPWCGKEGLQTPVDVPLKAIFILERADEGEETTVTELRMSEAFPQLLSQTNRPADAALMVKTLHLMSAMEGKVVFFRLRSNRIPEEIRKAYEAAVNLTNVKNKTSEPNKTDA